MTVTRRTRPTWQKLALLLAVVAFALALIGLSGAAASAGGTAQASRASKVDIKNFAFHPPTLTISKGSTVSFSNSSKVTHTATRGGAFDTGLIRPGKSVAVRFKQKGTFAYHCEIHPLMHGKIIVN
jgi:plastocyanin